MGPLALLGLGLGGVGLASIMKEKGIDLKKKKKPSKEQVKGVAKEVLKKKKADWQTEPDPKKAEKARETWKKTKKGFFDSLKRYME